MNRTLAATDVLILTREEARAIDAVASELFADCGPRLTGDDRARLAATLRKVLDRGIVLDERSVNWPD